MVVDDSALYRKVMRDILSGIAGVEVVAVASNGERALDQASNIDLDLMTLDVEMPVMNGIETLGRMSKEHPGTAVIMASSLTVSGASETVEALELGALDFVTKPEATSPSESREAIASQLLPIISALKTRRSRRNVPPFIRPTPATFSMRAGPEERPLAIVIGISTGGPAALVELIPGLPSKLPVPVLVVQHMPPVFTAQLAESLHNKSAINVVEATNHQPVKGGTVYIAPGGRQMKVTSSLSGGEILQVTDDPPEQHCKPSADYLFRSAAKVYGGRTLGVIMTGMGSDGVLGLRRLKRLQASVIAQDRETSTVWSMPSEAIKAGVVDEVLPLKQIAGAITTRVQG